MNTNRNLAVVFILSCFTILGVAHGNEERPNGASVKGDEMTDHVAQFDGSAIMWIEVSDLEASKVWYEKVLGANFFLRSAENQWIGMSPIEGLGIGLTEVSKPKQTETSPLSVNVQDINVLVASLSAAGYEPVGPILEFENVSRVAVFVDPTGHKITFSQYLGPK